MVKQNGYTDTDYLQIAGDLLRRVKEGSYALMGVGPGQKVLDMGCGPGTDTVALAHVVGAHGQVVGVDFDAVMVVEADQRAERAGVSAWVKHQQADATALPFEDNRFDASRSERVFQHLHDAEKALAEMIRVTKPGGRVVVLDSDWGSASMDSPDVETERRLVRFCAEHYLANGYSGRQLPRLFKRGGLTDIVVESYVGHTGSYTVARQIGFCEAVETRAVAAGIVTMEELERYRAGLERQAREGCFFAGLGGVMVAGRKAT